jgi:hypothetical protein
MFILFSKQFCTMTVEDYISVSPSCAEGTSGSNDITAKRFEHVLQGCDNLIAGNIAFAELHGDTGTVSSAQRRLKGAKGSRAAAERRRLDRRTGSASGFGKCLGFAACQCLAGHTASQFGLRLRRGLGDGYSEGHLVSRITLAPGRLACKRRRSLPSPSMSNP